MDVGILGSGVVGQQLGLGFTKLGCAVKLGTREPAKLKDWQEVAGAKATVGSFEAAAQFGELVVLATSWAGAENALRLAGPKNLAGKVVLDATNPLDFSKGTPPAFAASPGGSGGERVQAWLPGAKVVKAFNTINAYTMCNPKLQEGTPDLLICGDDEDAKRKVGSIAKAWGWPEPLDIGGISKAFYLEAFAMVWIEWAFRNNHWTHAFKLLRK